MSSKVESEGTASSATKTANTDVKYALAHVAALVVDQGRGVGVVVVVEVVVAKNRELD